MEYPSLSVLYNESPPLPLSELLPSENLPLSKSLRLPPSINRELCSVPFHHGRKDHRQDDSNVSLNSEPEPEPTEDSKSEVEKELEKYKDQLRTIKSQINSILLD